MGDAVVFLKQFSAMSPVTITAGEASFTDEDAQEILDELDRLTTEVQDCATIIDDMKREGGELWYRVTTKYREGLRPVPHASKVETFRTFREAKEYADRVFLEEGGNALDSVTISVERSTVMQTLRRRG